MTARHIDATDKTDGSHVVKILWNENDSERELTVRMPAAGTDATDRVDVDLLPVPGENSATTMDDAVAALEGFLGNNKYIHIDGDDVRSVCAGALTTVIRVESGSSTGIVEALDGRFHDSGVASDEVTGAIIAIEGPKSLQLSDATAIVGGVQKRLTDKVEIIWGLISPTRTSCAPPYCSQYNRNKEHDGFACRKIKHHRNACCTYKYEPPC